MGNSVFYCFSLIFSKNQSMKTAIFGKIAFFFCPPIQKAIRNDYNSKRNYYILSPSFFRRKIFYVLRNC